MSNALQNSRNVPKNAVEMAKKLASQAQLCAAISKEILLAEWATYLSRFGEESWNIDALMNGCDGAQTQDHFRMFPMLKLFVRYHNPLIVSHKKTPQKRCFVVR